VTPTATVLVLFSAVAAVLLAVWLPRARRAREQGVLGAQYGHLLFERANDAIYLLRTDGTILDANERACALYGYTRDELRTRKLADLREAEAHSDEQISAQLAQVSSSGGLVFENRHRRRDGTLFPVEVSSRLVQVGREKVFLSIVRDISERRRAEAELRESEQRQATILGSLPVAIYTARVPSPFDATWISESITRLTGFPASRFVEEPGFWTSRLHPEDRKSVEEAFAKLASTGEIRLHCRWQIADGSYRHFLDNAILLRADGAAREVIGTLLDITEQRQTETALRDSEQRYRTLVENIHDLVVEFDADGLVQYVSPNFELLAGYEPAEAVGRHVFVNAHPDDVEVVAAELKRTWLRGFGHFIYRLRHRSGEWRWLESFVRTYTTPAAQRQGVMLARDITQNKLAEEALRKSEAKNRAILSALPDLVFQLDRAGTFLGCTSPDDSLYLVPPLEFIGHKLEDVLPPPLATLTRDRLELALSTHDHQTYDYQLRVGGALCWFEARMVPVGDTTVVAVVRDITERKSSEEAIKASEAKYKSLTEQVPVGIYRTASSGTVIHANTALASILGYPNAEELIRSCNVEDTFARPDERARALAAWKVSRQPITQELELRRRDGSPIWVRDTGRAVLNPAGEVDYIDGIIEDISETKWAEEALRTSEVRYRQMFTMTRAIQLLVDPATACIVEANPAACEFYRFGAAELEGMSLGSIDLRPLPRIVEDLTSLAEQGGATVQARHRLASGEFRDVEAYLSPVEIVGKRFVYAIIQDVTRRLRAETERDRGIRLLQTTAAIASHFLTTPDPREAASQVVAVLGKAAAVDRCYWFESFTDETGALLVRVMGEWCGPGISSMADQPMLKALQTERFPRFLRALQGGEVVAGVVADFSPDEQALFALGGTQAVVVAPIIVRGAATGFLGFDLCQNPRLWQTDEIHLMHAAANAFAMALERWEQQLEREELAGVVEQASEAVIITDRNWCIRYVNPAYTKITGFGRDESVGLHPRDLMLKDPPSPLSPEAQLAPERGVPWTGILESRRKDEAPLLTQSTVFPLRDNAGQITGFASIHVDITAQLRLEEQLKRAQKMEALGQFASGIAHDFNNLITVIQGTAELLLRRVGDNAMLKEELTTVRRATLRSTELTSALLAFARRQLLQREDLDLNSAIGEALPMLRRVLPENITLRYKPAQPTCGVHADRGQIDQVLMNLVANARDAMSAGGSLTVATECVVLGADYVATHPWATAGHYVKMSVTDTGTGMDEATLARAFEPFFTTKEPGRGTGLGLSTAFGIVKQHGGMIDVYSVPGMGSTFNVYLPLLDREITPGPGHQEIPAVKGGDERILVVEDQGDLRRVLMSILQDLGYTVRGARDGMEALGVLDETKGAFDLVISDMVMPHMDGLALLKRCRTLFPGLAFLLQSGYSEAGRATEIPQSTQVGFISKPYSIEVLAHRVRLLLDTPPQPRPS
jgi:PAS domain S-box-containing protein